MQAGRKCDRELYKRARPALKSRMVSKVGQSWRWHSRILEKERSPILLDVGVLAIEKFCFPINRCGVEDVVAAREAEELEGRCLSRILLSHSKFFNSVAHRVFSSFMG